MPDTPSPMELQHLLKNDDSFRTRVAAFIQANIRVYVPGFKSAESVKAVPKEPNVAYSHLLHPDDPNYDEKFRRMEVRLVRVEQVHACHLRWCLTFKGGRLQCKQRAPFPCSEEATVLPSGEWSPKQLYGYINGWCPAILVNTRCNNDIKLLTNGEDTRNITFYVACYSVKKQGKSHNLSAIWGDGFAYHETALRPTYVNSIQAQHRLLFFRLVESINCEHGLAAVMVISYLMGWGDVYCSHSYTLIFWLLLMCQIYPNTSK
ncbi:hypothetical protein NUW54_g6886 [Trametes sanguinea]|uniref:Uncharacterized protein n=1 Tax=Trametes sanguinea TaxID=158606 RepID=A0ACC1PQY6_9APHY|nr:hypothetical protein NUW54_g6886 [Trametes sanguinea]